MDVPDKNVDILVNEMGFNGAEAKMALQDTHGNINQAVEKLLAGEYAPPPYFENQEDQFVASPLPSKNDDVTYKDNEAHSVVGNPIMNFLGDLTRRKPKVPEVKEDPTAPSFYDLTEQLHSSSLTLPPTAKLMPLPYEIAEKHNKVKDWEKEFNVFHVELNTPPPSSTQMSMMAQATDNRCGVCFSILKQSEGDILSQNGKFYHDQCFRKKFGPKCSHCCFPLSMPDKDHDLSGRYLVYQHKDYHVECYEKYAGPRCSHCFNVIIEKPNGELSGSWIVDGNYQYHTECYEKKLQNYWKAKNS